MTATKNRPGGNGAASKNHAGGSGDSSPQPSALDRRRAITKRLTPLEHGPVDPWADRPRPVLAAASLAAAAGILPPAALALAGVDALRAAWPHCADAHERDRVAAAARIAMAAQAAPTVIPGPNFAPAATMTTPEV